MEQTSDIRAVNDDRRSATPLSHLSIPLPQEKTLANVGGFALTNFDTVAIAAAVLMVCGPLLAAVIRVG